MFRRMTRAQIWAIALVSAIASPLAGQACVAREEGSRWVQAAPRMVPTARYGSGDTWLATVAGVAYHEGKVFVFDEGKPALIELSADLAPVREFGRAGKGPGEISGGVYVPFNIGASGYNYLGLGSDRIVFYDRHEVEVFDARGEFQYSVLLPDDSFEWEFGLIQVRPLSPDALLAVIDSVDYTGRKPRRLQAWLLEGHGRSLRRRLLWEFEVPSDTGEALRSRTRRDAQPYWDRSGACQVATDGSTRVLFRYDERAGCADSLMLPDWGVPDWGKAAGDGSAFSPVGRVADRGRPAALARWTDLVVDPDGWAWVRAWTEDRDELRIFAVSIASGEAVEVDAPAFPRAFGEPGVLYATVRNRETDESLLIRYEEKRP